jgi:hypothetical protein
MYYAMTLELATYGFLGGIPVRTMEINRFVSLAIALVAGRLVFIGAVIVLGSVIFNGQYVQAAIIPGLIAAGLQIATVPLIASWWIKKSGD